jgi:hypothetical protein
MMQETDWKSQQGDLIGVCGSAQLPARWGAAETKPDQLRKQATA